MNRKAKDSRELAAAAERAIAASSRTSPTPPGPTDSAGEIREASDPALVEAINQVFALFRLNYHNQYYAAFSEAEQLRQIKKLWLESLREYPPALILQGARRAIEHSEYLPTLKRMRECCDASYEALDLPALDAAYCEACTCTMPAEMHRWSHPVVYWAGRDCGWQFLASTNSTTALPRFTDAYRARCSALLRGEPLDAVPQPESPQLEAKALSPAEALRQLQRLRQDTGI